MLSDRQVKYIAGSRALWCEQWVRDKYQAALDNTEIDPEKITYAEQQAIVFFTFGVML